MNAYRITGKLPNLPPPISAACDDWLGCEFSPGLLAYALPVLPAGLVIENERQYLTLPGDDLYNGGMLEVAGIDTRCLERHV